VKPERKTTKILNHDRRKLKGSLPTEVVLFNSILRYCLLIHPSVLDPHVSKEEKEIRLAEISEEIYDRY
jgi:hypothetical protein